ncbi:hypothetical protein OMP38_26825 [Cohnella ginsengisoli]|uniref:DUF4328 domain-containing protein n=1 Tax=Cohnella ginsengisoli TaxID=425004 RepID=A0A9X4KMA2_9BACL|nr:hypothetical protein [Cohnella ginsengisoli]MDG0794034.1 hypothetical protein [Cohnella ginsengisoli]
MLSNLLKILLWVLVALGAASFLAIVIFWIDVDVFIEHVYPLAGIILDISSAYLYYIDVVIYLIWIYRVHMDLNRLYPHYPRTPGGALSCIMVPVYSLYGVPSVYLTIGTHFQTEASKLKKEGRWVSGLAVPLLILLICANILNQSVKRMEEPSTALLFSTTLANLILYVVFLMLCLKISQGLRSVNDSRNENLHASQDAVPTEQADEGAQPVGWTASIENPNATTREA